MYTNHSRFCLQHQLPSIATSMQSDQQSQTKEILSSSNSKRTKAQKLPGNQYGKLSPCARLRWFLTDCNERRRINLKICRVDFIYFIQKPSIDRFIWALFMGELQCLLLGFGNQINNIPPGRSLGLSFFFHYKVMNSLKSNFSL